MIAAGPWACDIPRVRKLIPIFFSAALCLAGCGEEEGTETPEPNQEDDQPSFEPHNEDSGAEPGK